VPVGGAAADPWAETEDVEYEDADTGEKFIVRAPKTYAEKVKGGYARRSVMDRNNRYLKQNRDWLEPLIERGGFESLRGIIERGVNDKPFGDAVTEIYRRATAGLPLFDAPPAQPGTAAPSAAAAAVAGAPAPEATREPDVNDVLAALDNDDTIDDYTRSILKKVIAPITTRLATLAQTEATRVREGVEAQQRLVAKQQRDKREREFGLRMRSELQRHYPTEFIEGTTPPDKYVRVYNYARDAKLFEQYGFTPATILLAKQAMDNPMGIEGVFGGVPAAPASVARATVESAAAEGDRLAAEAARGVARATAPVGGAAAAPAERDGKKAVRIPRYTVDKMGKKRPLSPTEIAERMSAAS